MAKKQHRIHQKNLENTAPQWMGQPVSLLLYTGVVHEVRPLLLQEGVLQCYDALNLKHNFSLLDIKEIILNFPVAEHAQTSAD